MWLLLLPDLYLSFKVRDLYYLALSLFFIFYFFSIIKSSKYIFLFFPFFFIIPAYLYYISIYQTNINEQILSIILETDYQEAIAFFGNKLFIYLIFWIIWCIGCLKLFYKNYKSPLIWNHRSRLWVLIIGTLYFTLIYALNLNLDAQAEEFIPIQRDNFLTKEKNPYIQDIKKTYPLGFFISISDLIKEQKKINFSFEKNKKFKFNAKQNLNMTQKQIYILVIGETSRRKNWQLNGYTRKTNPLLSQQKNIVNFNNMLSISSATRTSIPMILTRKSADQIYNYNFPEKSIISAFKEVGFKTYWLSTQQKFGNFDTSTSVYAKEADQVIFLNKANYTDAGEHDDVILPVLNKIVHRNENKQFIVVHTLGSHYNYAHRYPKEYDIFRPSLNDLSKYSLQEVKYKQQLVNSYDNSILFTDHVLNEFIETLKQQKDAESFLLYTSDHGEDLFDNGCGKSGHGLDTQHNLEIASFAWYSDLFASQYPSQIAYLIQNKDRKINQTAIFPTLIQAAKIHIPEYTEEKSILSPFKDYPRLVLGGKNFDSAQYDKICKEIK
ncbi:sulfatase-like hydrolase/transferase [Acinetobacter sp. R933-2]|nr:sulfatase-like hydrolase/transferase [Acinetobacter sp. R933-2]